MRYSDTASPSTAEEEEEEEQGCAEGEISCVSNQPNAPLYIGGEGGEHPLGFPPQGVRQPHLVWEVAARARERGWRTPYGA